MQIDEADLWREVAAFFARVRTKMKAPSIGGKHFNGDVIIESFDNIPTHWMPVPVAKKAGV